MYVNDLTDFDKNVVFGELGKRAKYFSAGTNLYALFGGIVVTWKPLALFYSFQFQFELSFTGGCCC